MLYFVLDAYRPVYGQVVLKNMIKSDLGNCESADSLGHVNYTVTVMINVSLCLHFFLFFFFA